jgi:hypothetical protein
MELRHLSVARNFEVSRRFLENVRTFALDRPPRVGCWRQKNLWMCNFSFGGGIRLRDADGVIFNNVLLVKFSQSPLIISVESRRCVLNRHVHQKFNIRIAGFLSCLPKHVIEGKIEATGRRGRSRKQLLDDLK